MTSQRTRVELRTATTLLEKQWQTLRGWLGRVVDDDDAGGVLAAPGVLPGFTVAELIAHIGRSLDVLAQTAPADPGVLPLSLAEYLGAYRDRAESVARTARSYAEEIAAAPLRTVDRIAAAAFLRLADLGPDDCVVQTRRAPIMLSGLVVSRLVELVVHGDDLARALDAPRHPGDREAVSTVATVLGVAYGELTGGPPMVSQPLTWIRLAAGREPSEDQNLPLL